MIPIADSRELVRGSGLPESALVIVGTDHRLADPEPLAAMLDAANLSLPTLCLGIDVTWWGGSPRKRGVPEGHDRPRLGGRPCLLKTGVLPGGPVRRPEPRSMPTDRTQLRRRWPTARGSHQEDSQGEGRTVPPVCDLARRPTRSTRSPRATPEGEGSEQRGQNRVEAPRVRGSDPEVQAEPNNTGFPGLERRAQYSVRFADPVEVGPGPADTGG